MCMCMLYVHWLHDDAKCGNCEQILLRPFLHERFELSQAHGLRPCRLALVPECVPADARILSGTGALGDLVLVLHLACCLGRTQSHLRRLRLGTPQCGLPTGAPPTEYPPAEAASRTQRAPSVAKLGHHPVDRFARSVRRAVAKAPPVPPKACTLPTRPRAAFRRPRAERASS